MYNRNALVFGVKKNIYLEHKRNLRSTWDTEKLRGIRII